MSPQSSMQTCTHERGHGTTVCLHCRYEARVAARERRARYLMRGGAAAAILLTVGAAGVAGASALRGRSPSHSPSPNMRAASVDEPSPAEKPAEGPASATTTPHEHSAPRGDASAAAPSTAVHAATPLLPVIPVGQSTLADGVMAARTDSGVVLSFDLPMIRTRMPVKFEHFVRTTLPEIYGPPADSALAKMPDGTIASQGDLLTELPTRGVRIPAEGGWTLVVYPETRPGYDGPLVIRYRVVPVKG